MIDKDPGLIYSNVGLRQDRAYVLFVGDAKYIDTTTMLSEPLTRRYNKPTEIINVLPNMPPPYMTGNFIVVNNELADFIANDGGGKYFLPLDQIDINRDVSNSSYIKATVEGILKSQKDVFINVFKSTPELTLADGKRVKIIGPRPDLFNYFDDKIIQRQIMEELGIPIPKGYVANSFEELVDLYKANFQEDAFVTTSRGFGGNGTTPISSLDDMLTSGKLNGKDKFILTELLDLKSSLCAIGLVANEEEVMFVSVSDQLMDGVDYIGNIYPSSASPENARKIEEYVTCIGRYLGSKGYKGAVGVDFMIDKSDQLYFTEINPRKVGHIPEIIFAYDITNPNMASIPELEFLAVAEGTFGIDTSQYKVPQMDWSVLGVKAKKGQRTLNYIPRDPKEKEIFKDSGITVLDHPGEDVVFLDEGRLARIVCVGSDNDSRDDVLQRLEAEKAKIKVV